MENKFPKMAVTEDGQLVMGGVGVGGTSNPTSSSHMHEGGTGGCGGPGAVLPTWGSGGHESVVDDPNHYRAGTFEVIDEMVLAFGIDATINFCVLNAWKYRARAPYKGKLVQDLEKADRYMQYAHDLMLKKAKQGGMSALPLLKSSGKRPVSDKDLKEKEQRDGARR